MRLLCFLNFVKIHKDLLYDRMLRIKKRKNREKKCCLKYSNSTSDFLQIGSIGQYSINIVQGKGSRLACLLMSVIIPRVHLNNFSKMFCIASGLYSLKNLARPEFTKKSIIGPKLGIFPIFELETQYVQPTGSKLLLKYFCNFAGFF